MPGKTDSTTYDVYSDILGVTLLLLHRKKLYTETQLQTSGFNFKSLSSLERSKTFPYANVIMLCF